MRPTKTPSPEYLPVSSLNMASKRLNLAINAFGVVALLLASWLLFQLAEELRPGILAPSSFLLLGGPELLALIAGLAGVIVLHELIHGLFFWAVTGERFQLGIRPFYAFAASPSWTIPRGQFVVIGLAPLLIITSLGIALLWILPLSASAVVLVSIAVNAAGSTGDLVVIGWLFARPSGRLVRDTGDVITKYEMASEEIASMAQRWMVLIGNYKVDDEAGRWLFTKIVRAYNGDGRYYHNLGHIGFVLNTIADLEPLAKDYHSVLLAAWFHDIVYEADNQGNERQSARFGYEALIELGVDEETASRVSDLILMTADHNPPEDDGDAKILIDADLAPFAFDKELFNQQSEALRLEFAQIPEDDFNASRKQFLTSMIDREQIFLTRQLHEELEGKARENIKQSLAALS